MDAATRVCAVLKLNPNDVLTNYEGRVAIQVPDGTEKDHADLIRWAKQTEPLVTVPDRDERDARSPRLGRLYLLMPHAWEKHAHTAKLFAVAAVLLMSIAVLLAATRLAGHPKWRETLVDAAHQTLTCWRFSDLVPARLQTPIRTESSGPSPASPAPALAEPGSLQAPRSE